MTAPIIVSALFGAEDHRWLDGERKAHFPPERNVIPAHLTLFHHLPPSVEEEICTRLRQLCLAAPPAATISAPFSLGRGVAYRVTSPDLEAMRADLAAAFGSLLTPQDRAGWRPHVTIQNKVAPEQARALFEELQRGFVARPLAIAGLAAWWYRGGPWEAIGAWRFGSSRPMVPPR